jgi:hypothetical protein
VNAWGSLPWEHVLERAKERIGAIEEIAIESQGTLKAIVRPVPKLFEVGTDGAKYPGILGLGLAPFAKILHPMVEDTPEGGLSKHGHVLAGLFTTARRSDAWIFLPTSIRLPLNILIDRNMQNEVKELLRKRPLATLGTNTIPVVLRGGAAHEYLYDLIGPESLHAVESLEKDGLLQLAQAKERKLESVVVVDAIRLFRAARNQKNKSLELIFPDWPDLEESSDGTGYTMPSFPLAIGVRSSPDGLAARLASILKTHLQVDRFRIVSEYLDEVVKLAKNINAEMETLSCFHGLDTSALSRKWARRICMVDEFSLSQRLDNDNPWKPICSDVCRRLDKA